MGDAMVDQYVIPLIFPLFPFLHRRLTRHSLARCIALLRDLKTVPEKDVKELCNRAREILIEESNVQIVDPPVVVRLSLLLFFFCL